MMWFLAAFCLVKVESVEVIGAGVSRTSTQSLSLALKTLGYKTLHAEGFHPKLALPGMVDLVTRTALSSFERQSFEELLPALRRVEALNVTALVDIPWSEYGVELHQRYPGSKVIVTVREPRAWLRSYWEHFRWGAFMPPLLPSFPISQPFPLTLLHQPFVHYWRLVSQRLHCGAITQFPPRMLSARQEKECLQGFDEHVEALKRAIPPELLLVYNIRDGWAPLCEFLQLPVPHVPFPREDSYSCLHWRVGPLTFLASVYLAYGLLGLVLVKCLLRMRVKAKLA